MATKKFSPMRFTAASEEAAVEGALGLVGATRDEISYDVIGETAKGVTVRIRPRDDETPQSAPVAVEEPPVIEDETDEEIEIEAEAPLHIDSVREEFDEDDETDEDAGDDELDFDPDLELEGDEYDDDETDEFDEESEDDEEVEAEPVAEIDAESLERALILAREMLAKMGLDAQVGRGETDVPDTIPLTIEGEDVGILIGKHGATLQSFQYLMNLTLNNARAEDEDGIRVTVDAGNYRARRQESLETVARSAAQRARREGRPIKLEPMPANERRIVHNILQTEPGISTQSEGREPHRCIVIAPGASDYKGSSERGPNRGGARGMGGYNRGRGGRGRR